MSASLATTHASLPLRRPAVGSRWQPRSSRPPPVLRLRAAGEQAAADVASTEAAAAPEQPPAAQQQQLKKGTLEEEDFWGFEVGDMPRVADAQAASADEPAEAAAEDNLSAEYQARLRDALGDWMPEEGKRSKITCMEQLESIDGMVGNYEERLEQQKEEAQSTADEVARLLEDLKALEAVAGMRSAEAGEGAGVEDGK